VARKTPPWPDYPEWTTSRFWSFIRSGLRSKFNKWPPKWEALKDAKRTVSGQRHRIEYQCALCKEWYKTKEVEVDHIEEVGSLKDYKDLPLFVERLFVPKNKLQVLCRGCHKEKTQRERMQRLQNK